MENNESCCLAKILKVIDIIQKESGCLDLDEGCDRPFLGNTSGAFFYNTRPITLYNRDGSLFKVTYYVNNVATTSSVFRVEEVDDCCAKLRILSTVVSDDVTVYASTGEYVTINLNCFCVLQCLDDTYVEI